MTSRRSSSPRTLRQHLIAFTFRDARELLGPNGAHLLRQCRLPDDFDPIRDAYLDDHLFQVTFRDYDFSSSRRVSEDVVVSLTDSPPPLACHCSQCSTPEHPEAICPHVAATLALILEEKPLLGLVTQPDMETPLELLSEEQLVERALFERRERARTEPMTWETTDPSVPWTDYHVHSGLSGHTYRVALRGEQRGDSFCECPDFRANTLGTCKHIEFVLNAIRRLFPKSRLREPFRNSAIFVHVRYGETASLHLCLPDESTSALRTAAKKYLDRPIDDVRGLVKLVARLEQAGFPVTIYPDAEEWIASRLFQQVISEEMTMVRENPSAHPLLTTLLTRNLLPYQLDGIAFAVMAGRAILADEAGLGKTMQAIGVAELFARHASIRKVLVVCPTASRTHWGEELRGCSKRSVHFVRGDEPVEKRYARAFFTVASYEQILADIDLVEKNPWDLIILDDAERLCDWKSKTAATIKRLHSLFALVLTSTLPENRLEALHAIVQFIDARRLPPAFRFFHRFRSIDATGNVVAYKDLDELRRRIKPILLRRTRNAVHKELPPCTTRIIPVAMQPEQRRLHDAALGQVCRLLGKQTPTELDMLRIHKHLLAAQRCCDGATLIAHESEESSAKLVVLRDMLPGLFAEGCRMALFSEWETMLDATETMLRDLGVPVYRIPESAQRKERRRAITDFFNNAGILLTTGEAARDLNIEKIDIVVHLDLPWNPVMLQRRIDTVRPTGRKKPIQMLLFIAEGSLEERLLAHPPAPDASILAALGTDASGDTLPLIDAAQSARNYLTTLLDGAAPPLNAKAGDPMATLQSNLHRDADGRCRLVLEFDTPEKLDALVAMLAKVLPFPFSDSESPMKK